ncbi:MAG: metallophosphoesterase family protein [Thermacetogeniaceae bacterium]
MRFLHTGDVHLAPEAPVRFETLRSICEMAQEFRCDALLIAGDLFDSVEAASDMRGKVRELFDSLVCSVCLIPGNHDAGAFSCGQYYGSNVLSAGSEPAIWEIGDVPVVALPFAPGRAAYERLCSLPLPKRGSPLVVLAHGSFYSSASATVYQRPEDEGGCGEAYFWDRDFADFPPAYVALGHWHNPTLPPMQINQALIAYSGTPYPLARGETGPRKVLLVDISGDGIKVEGVEIPGVPRRERIFFWFLPGYEERTIEEIRRYLSEAADPDVILDVETGGWLGDVREEAVVGEVAALVAQLRRGWKEVNLVTPQFTAIGSLSGFGRKCLELLDEIEPPDVCEIEDFADPLLRALAEEVLEEREDLCRQALSFLLRYLEK